MSPLDAAGVSVFVAAVLVSVALLNRAARGTAPPPPGRCSAGRTCCPLAGAPRFGCGPRPDFDCPASCPCHEWRDDPAEGGAP